jgi:hypothetical protein
MPHARRYLLVSGTTPRAPDDVPIGIASARVTSVKLPTVAAIAAATTATPATTTAPTPATAAPTPATAAATEATPLGAFFGLIDPQRPTVERRAVHGLDRLLCLCRRPHRNEPKASRLTRGSVGHDVNVRYFSDARKRLAHRLVRGRK